jgi:hypothetical protein
VIEIVSKLSGQQGFQPLLADGWLKEPSGG